LHPGKRVAELAGVARKRTAETQGTIKDILIFFPFDEVISDPEST
jgi:hypothetical protein